jgi:hypothetical protein
VIFQVVVKDWQGYRRPYPIVTNEREAMFAVARGTREGAGERLLILYATNPEELELVYWRLAHGFPVQYLEISPEGMRVALEFQPLRDEYPVGTAKPLDAAGFTREQMRSLIGVMARVQVWNELGGEHDGHD